MFVHYQRGISKPIGQSWGLQCLAAFSGGHIFPFPCLRVKTRMSQLTKKEMLLTNVKCSWQNGKNTIDSCLGVSTSLVLVWVPRPHVLLQSPHPLQLLTSQSTSAMVKWFLGWWIQNWQISKLSSTWTLRWLSWCCWCCFKSCWITEGHLKIHHHYHQQASLSIIPHSTPIARSSLWCSTIPHPECCGGSDKNCVPQRLCPCVSAALLSSNSGSVDQSWK